MFIFFKVSFFFFLIILSISRITTLTMLKKEEKKIITRLGNHKTLIKSLKPYSFIRAFKKKISHIFVLKKKERKKKAQKFNCANNIHWPIYFLKLSLRWLPSSFRISIEVRYTHIKNHKYHIKVHKQIVNIFYWLIDLHD